jgi:hypothetical protein
MFMHSRVCSRGRRARRAQEAATHIATAVSARGYKIIVARQKPIPDLERKFFRLQANRSG